MIFVHGKVLAGFMVQPDAVDFITFLELGTFFIHICYIALFSMLAVTGLVILAYIFNLFVFLFVFLVFFLA